VWELFTLAAYEFLGECEYPEGRGLSSASALGDALYGFQSAAVDFLRAGQQDRVENRCRQGILVAEDFRAHADTHTAIDGVLTECIADYLQIASLDNPEETYDEALRYYDSVPESSRWQSEPIFQSTIYLLLSLASDLGDPIEEATQLDAINSFEKRIELKRTQLPSLLTELEH
jgi:hypothetical protein